MEMNGQIFPWYDGKLIADDEGDPSVLQELKKADIVACQLSRNYLAPDNCQTPPSGGAVGFHAF